MRPGVRIDGLRQTIRTLEKFGVATTDLRAAMRKVGGLVADTGKQLAPTQTGRLAATIRPGAAKNKAVIRAGLASTPYAGVIHFGWPGHNIEPQPFLFEAVARRRTDAVLTLDQELHHLIARYGLNK